MKFVPVWFSLLFLAFSSILCGQQWSTPFPHFPSPVEHEVWYGRIEQPQQHLRVLFSWKKGSQEVEGSVVILDQAMSSQPIAKLVRNADQIEIGVPAAKLVYVGRMSSPNECVGEWQQGAAKVPLTLRRIEQPMREHYPLVFRSQMRVEKEGKSASMDFQFRFSGLERAGGATRSKLGYFDSLSEKIGSILCDYTEEGGKVTIDCPLVKGKFSGVVSSDGTQVVGKFEQNQLAIEMTLHRCPSPLWFNEPYSTPAAPTLPQSVSIREQLVSMSEPHIGERLSGTLTLPNKVGKYPVVVMVPSHEAPDRNGELGNDGKLRELSQHLASQGYASVRFDARGIGFSSGDFGSLTVAGMAVDTLAVCSGLSSFPEIEPSKIFVLGHRDGAVVAAQAAAWSSQLRGVVLMASPSLLPATAYDATRIAARHGLTPWQSSLEQLSTSSLLLMVRSPVLSLLGEYDAQVSASEAQESMLESLKRGGNQDSALLIMPSMDESFSVEGSKKSGASTREMDSRVKGLITDWLDACLDTSKL